MQPVRYVDERTYLLVKRSADSSRIRDPETGEERYVPTADLTPVDAESPLETAASGVPESVRRLISAVHSDRTLGLLITVVDDGPLSVLELMNATDLCESDAHGQFAEFRAAGLVVETTVDGLRGYGATPRAVDAVARLRLAVEPVG